MQHDVITRYRIRQGSPMESVTFEVIMTDRQRRTNHQPTHGHDGSYEGYKSKMKQGGGRKKESGLRWLKV